MRGWETWDWRRLRWDIRFYKYQKGEYKEALFSGSPCQGKRHKLKHMRFPLNITKCFFTVWVMEHWHRLPRESVESPFLEIFKSYMDVVLCILLWVSLQGFGPDGFQRYLPTSTTVILWRNLIGFKYLINTLPKNYSHWLIGKFTYWLQFLKCRPYIKTETKVSVHLKVSSVG